MYHSLQAVERALLCSLPLLHCLNGCWENQQRFTDTRNKKKKKQAHSSVFRMIGIPSNPLSVCRTENADTSKWYKYVCNSPTVGALVTRVTTVTLVTWDLRSINSPCTQATTTSLGCTFGFRTMNPSLPSCFMCPVWYGWSPTLFPSHWLDTPPPSHKRMTRYYVHSLR